MSWVVALLAWRSVDMASRSLGVVKWLVSVGAELCLWLHAMCRLPLLVFACGACVGRFGQLSAGMPKFEDVEMFPVSVLGPTEECERGVGRVTFCCGNLPVQF